MACRQPAAVRGPGVTGQAPNRHSGQPVRWSAAMRESGSLCIGRDLRWPHPALFPVQSPPPGRRFPTQGGTGVGPSQLLENMEQQPQKHRQSAPYQAVFGPKNGVL